MKSLITRFLILLSFIFLFPSCRNRKPETIKPETVHINNYSGFPQGSILSGETKEGKTLYLIREDETKMAGVCFIDNDFAIVERITFCADSTGNTTFEDIYSGTMLTDPLFEGIKLSLPKMLSFEIDSQTIHINYVGTIPEKVHCPEHFKEIISETIRPKKNVKYGTASGYYTSKPVNQTASYEDLLQEAIKIKREVIKNGESEKQLYLDMYYPDTENMSKFPLLLFIHGGAFFYGDKEDPLQQAITEYLVKRGYVVVSINYRMGSILTELPERTYYHNVQDTRAALRFLLCHKDTYQIDDEQIYLAGSSAGGFIALKTAFMDHSERPWQTYGTIFVRDLGGLDDLEKDYKADFKIAGVISMWGAVSDLTILNDTIPTLLFHGTNDKLVPMGTGAPFESFFGAFSKAISLLYKVHGSESIRDYLKSKNIPVTFVEFPGCKHEVHIDPSDGSLHAGNVNKICNEMGRFLFENVSKHYFDYHLSGDTLIEKYDLAPIYYLHGNVEDVSVQWHVEGGFITKCNKKAIRVVWYNSFDRGTVTACITNENGASCKKELKVKITF